MKKLMTIMSLALLLSSGVYAAQQLDLREVEALMAPPPSDIEAESAAPALSQDDVNRVADVLWPMIQDALRPMVRAELTAFFARKSIPAEQKRLAEVRQCAAVPMALHLREQIDRARQLISTGAQQALEKTTLFGIDSPQVVAVLDRLVEHIETLAELNNRPIPNAVAVRRALMYALSQPEENRSEAFKKAIVLYM